MPTADYLGHAMTGAGDWPSGRGTSGHYMRDPSYAPVVSLPANVTSLTWAAGTGDRLDGNASLTRWLALPSGIGGRTVSSWIRRLAVPADPAPYYILDLPDSTAVECAQYGHTSVGGLRLTITSEDGATTYADSGDLGLPVAAASNGTWLFYRVRGPGRVRITTVDTNIRIQGILFNSGSASYSDPGLGGLAIGGDWPASLAIATPAPGGIEVGVGSGLDPSTTRVEAGYGGIEVGGDWPASAALAGPALGGIEVGGEWAASAGWAGPATLRAALYARLLDSAALAAVVGDRVFHARIPQRKDFPAVVFTTPSRSYGHNLGGGDGTSTANVQVDCWAATAVAAEEAAEAVRLAFQGFRGRVGSVEFTACLVDDVGEIVTQDSPGKDAWTYRHLLMIDATHRVSIPTF